jgi:hypothetical protein
MRRMHPLISILVQKCSAHLRTAVLVLPAAFWVGCAQQASTPQVITGYKAEAVQVLAAMPMSQPEAKAACPPEAPQNPAPARATTTDANAGSNQAASPPVTDAGFCVLYELQGQTYSVWLPTDPGASLTIQVPVYGPAPQPGYAVVHTPAPYPFIYPSVFFYGGYYRPRPYVSPVSPIPPAWRRGPPGTMKRNRH